MTPKEVTIYDIAARLNIAASIVSRGLKGSSSVKAETRRKIVETAMEMGYQSNPFASGLRTKRTNAIGLIIPRINSDFMASVIAGIENIVNSAGFTLIITQSLESKEKEIRNAQALFSQRVDGLLVSLSEDTSNIEHFKSFSNKQIPVLFFDRVPDQQIYSSVTINNEEAAYQATKHLISKGARRIVHISSDQKIGTYRKRFQGFLRALEENNLGFEPDLLLLNDLSEASGSDTARCVIDLNADAVLAANDVSAAACIKHLKAAGLKIPDDILVAGFNNDIISRNVSPALTTVNNPGFQIGGTAASCLIAQLSGGGKLTDLTAIFLESELIPRDSTNR